MIKFKIGTIIHNDFIIIDINYKKKRAIIQGHYISNGILKFPYWKVYFPTLNKFQILKE